MLAKYGINLANPEGSLDKFTAADRARFFLDWYDQLMTYSGADHVDHWMGTTNWSPSITQHQGGGADNIIGLLNFTVAGDRVKQGATSSTTGSQLLERPRSGGGQPDGRGPRRQRRHGDLAQSPGRRL